MTTYHIFGVPLWGWLLWATWLVTATPLAVRMGAKWGRKHR